MAETFDGLTLQVNGETADVTWKQIADMIGYNASEIKELKETGEHTKNAVNISWMMMATTLVFIMQAGFTMVEVGSVRIKNTKSILVKNLLDACVGSVMFYIYGWAFSFGKGNAFLGYNGFVLMSGFNRDGTEIVDPYQYALWTFQYTFCATASTIVSGAVAERTQLFAYLVYTFFLVTVIYPPVAHSIWTDEGWASPYNPNPLFGVGAIDFAGGVVVHVVGGTCALIGSILVGPRQGRFVKNSKIVKQNAVFQVLGTLLLWFGWYGFNCGSTMGLGENLSNSAAKIGVATTLSASSSGTTTILLNFFLDRRFDPAVVCNGILAGLVSITGGCAVVEPYGAFIIGVIGAHVYYFGSKLLVNLKIDDVVDASPVHLGCGIWGAIATTFFCHPITFRDSFSKITNVDNGYGVFYDGAKGGKLLGANLVFLIAAISYVSAIAAPMFFVLKMLRLLRINNIEENKGQDKVMHGGVAYENPTANSNSSIKSVTKT
ncbi:uncharacterized protein LOC134826670 [Bolinopsis microptera]|uniref:uncharacterized protein LOC134826670 n=1 Tax=Bolinopsis microptera TaxID=2820187 RepID=UPI00307AFB17